MSEYTKGPWWVDGHKKDGCEVWGNGGPTWSFRIAVTGHAQTFDYANAKLIAQAPRLLEMLQFAVDELQLVSDEQDGRFGGSLDKMITVIADAGGERMIFNGTGTNPSATESVGAQIARIEAENKRLRKTLAQAYQELRHAYIYIKSREKMSVVGQDLYLQTMTTILEALEVIK